MKLDEIMPIEKWVELEKEINRKSGLNAAVFDAAGVRITDFKKWANRLCPAIRETGKGLKFICSECDAGLMKFAVPIFLIDDFLGVVGGCGLLRHPAQIDAYLVHRTTGMEEAAVKSLSEDIETIPAHCLATVVDYLEHKVVDIVREYRAGYLNVA